MWLHPAAIRAVAHGGMVHLAVIHRAMAAVSGVGAMVLRGRCGSLAMGGVMKELLEIKERANT